MRKRQYQGPERARSSADTAGAPSLRDVREEYATLAAAVSDMAHAVRASLAIGETLSDMAIVQRLAEVFRSPEFCTGARWARGMDRRR